MTRAGLHNTGGGTCHLLLGTLSSPGTLYFNSGYTYTLYPLNSTYNEKTYAESLLHYGWLFIKGNVITGEWGIFGVQIFLCYS